MPTKEQQLKKLITFEENKDLAIFDELNELNQSIKEVIEAVNNSKIEEVKISNLMKILLLFLILIISISIFLKVVEILNILSNDLIIVK